MIGVRSLGGYSNHVVCNANTAGEEMDKSCLIYSFPNPSCFLGRDVSSSVVGLIKPFWYLMKIFFNLLSILKLYLY